MSDLETRDKRSKQRKRNYLAKITRESKIFSPYIKDKPTYKREKLNPRDYQESEEDDEL